MLHFVVAALLVAYVPGALVFRTPVGARHLRAALPAEERTFWAVLLSIAWSVSAVLALAGARAFTFDRLLIVNTIVSGAIVLAWRRRLSYGPTAARPGWSAALPVALVIGGAFLYFPTAEYIIGGKDPGTYLNEGVQIAQRGGLIVDDPVVAAVPPASRDLFFPWHRNPWYYGLRFMGFFIRDPGPGEVIGQFPHLFPASIAIGYGFDGLSGARNTAGLWALLGLLAVYFCGARLFGPIAAAAGAALLAINVIQVWFARYPNSEMPMQALLFAALLAFARAGEGSRGFFGTVAGLLLGLQLFLRYDIVLAFAAMAAAATILPVAGRRVGYAFTGALVASGAIGLWYLANPMLAYSAYPLGFTRDRGGWGLVALGVAGVLLFRWLIGRAGVAAIVRRLLPAVLTIAVIALATYAYFFRQEAGRTALHDAMAFRTFGWYLTPAVLWITVLGMSVLVWFRFWRDPAFFLTLTTFAVFFFYKTRIVPEHFWTARRFLAVILPGAMLVLAGLATELVDLVRSRRIDADGQDRAAPVLTLRPAVGSLIAAALLAPIAVIFWRQAEPVRRHIEYEGLIPRLEQLAGGISAEELVLVESRDAGSDLHALALPLAYVYDRNVLVLDSVVPPKRQLENFVAWAQTKYSRVLFLGGGGTNLLTRRLAAEPLAADRFRVPEYDARVNAYPEGIRHKDFEFGLYSLSLQEPVTRGPIDLEIGARDDLHVVRFYAREQRGSRGTLFRWSGPQSFVLLLGIAADARRVTISMGNGGRPATEQPASVEVALGEHVLGTTTVGTGISPYTFDLPADLAASAAASEDPVPLRLRVPTWTPSDTGGTDTRALGVVVTRVTVQ